MASPVNPHFVRKEFSHLDLWEKAQKNRSLLSIAFELTARCNCNCRHCCVNLPAADQHAKQAELAQDEIESIADEAKDLGALWCLLTGGEPLLRPDFEDIYVSLKRKGLLVTVFTNATLITDRHVELFKRFPPRELEVSVYGADKETYERVTRAPGSFAAFTRGLRRLTAAGVKVGLKAMALRSNEDTFPLIADFCREHSSEPFRFDPFLNCRVDGNAVGNTEIRSERLSPQAVVELERADHDRAAALEKKCAMHGFAAPPPELMRHFIYCAAGISDCHVGYDGTFRLCDILDVPGFTYDLHKGSLTDAWRVFVPKARAALAAPTDDSSACRRCPILDFCQWCPAHAHLETGDPIAFVGAFCDVAHARTAANK